MSAAEPLLVGDLTVLAPFVDAGVLDASAVHVAGAVARASGGLQFEVLLGAALAARAPRFGHVCVELPQIAGTVVVDEPGLDEREAQIRLLPWPPLPGWRAALSASPAVRLAEDPPGEEVLPLVFDGTRLYLDRYWRYEQRTADGLRRLAEGTGALAPEDVALQRLLDRLFAVRGGAERTAELAAERGAESGDPEEVPDRQREAVACALSGQLTVIAGGPGTGKTFTVERLLAGAHILAMESGRDLEVALAAPTGKAAARMTEAVRRRHAAGADPLHGADLPAAVAERVAATEATTIHRLLGGNSRGHFAHDRSNPLPHDLVVVDETSMVSLPLMARLIDAVRPSASLVLVGDPFQLASVEAGAVLGEVVGPAATGTTATAATAAGATATGATTAGFLAQRIVMLERRHRFAGPIADLADAIRVGDAPRAVQLLTGDAAEALSWVDPDDTAGVDALRRQLAELGSGVLRAAGEGAAEEALALSGDTKVLCATRRGPLGVEDWTRQIETAVARLSPSSDVGRLRWYVGRPVMVTENDYLNHLFNGDTGVVVRDERGAAVAFPGVGGSPANGGPASTPLRRFGTSQLGDVATWWASTIHKSQGSEFERVVVCLPSPPSPVLTRELLYTAVTRAKTKVTLVASESALTEAIARPVARASGLGQKLWPPQSAKRTRASSAQLLWTWRQSGA